MLSDIQRRMAMQGLTAHVAMAATPGAAQALARYGSIQICDDIPAALAPLPTAALRLDDTTVQLLNRAWPENHRFSGRNAARIADAAVFDPSG